jgi:hypothetical protein
MFNHASVKDKARCSVIKGKGNIIKHQDFFAMTMFEASVAAVTALLVYGLWRVTRSPLRRWRSRRGA